VIPPFSPEASVIGALAAPFAAALIIPLFRDKPDAREAVTLVGALALFAFVVSLVPPVLAGERPSALSLAILPGVSFGFRVEPLGMLFGLIAATLWIVNSVYSIGYMRANGEPRQTRFYVCFAVALGSTIGVAFAADLFTLFLFYEALTISTYPLVIHHEDPEARRAGRLYILMLLGTSLLLFLPAIVTTSLLAGTLDFAPGGIMAGMASPSLTALLLALFLFGVGKAALMPLHFWLPAAMVAPTPVSALLHAVAVVKAGVFTILKIVVLIFGVDALRAGGHAPWLTIVAGATILAASIVALRQDNLKRRLAYSTVSQLAYVVLGAAILTPISVVGAALHIAAHAVSKITLFFVAGSIHTAAHLTEVSQLDGIGRRMPLSMGAFGIGALAMIGIPPTVGLIGKWFILSGAVESANWVAVGIIVVSTALNAGYFLPIVHRAFLRQGDPSRHAAAVSEAPRAIVAALLATAVGTVLLFFWPNVPLALAQSFIGR
jgi:multicomponent Na+:H+ antiporter subunit D